MRSKTYKGKTEFNKDKDQMKSNKRKGSKRDIRKDETLDKSNRDNDPNWYFVSPELATQASQLSFQSLLGFGSIYGYQTPTILRVNTVMNPGVTYKADVMNKSFDPHSSYELERVMDPDPGKAGVNLMAAKLYTTLSSFTGRTASYAPQDVAMMILQISSIAEISETIRRCFGIALTYNGRNRAVPLGLLRSMSVNVDDFIKNLSIYRMRFNVAMSRINQIPLLENIAFIKKSRDVYQRVYMDDPTNMAQLFYHMPFYYFVLNEQGDTDGSILEAKAFIAGNPGGRTSMSTMLSALEEMITTALESSTLNFIYADLLNMANKLSVPTWQFDYLAENYVVMPEYNANALLQLHNMTIMGSPMPVSDVNDVNKRVKSKINSLTLRDVYVTSGAHVYCDANSNDIVYNPAFSCDRPMLPQWFVDMPTDNPTVEDRIEALRYTSMNTGEWIVPSSISDTISGNGYVFNALPDHYVRNVVLFRNIDYTQSEVPATELSQSIIGTTPELGDNIARFIAGMTQFEHAPNFATASGEFITAIYGALQYYTMYDCDYIGRLLDIMNIGLWDFRVK